jgi:hypothetical protein
MWPGFSCHAVSRWGISPHDSDVEARVCVASAALRETLAPVEAELDGFTTALAAWAEAQVPALAGARIDELARELGLRILR